LFSIKHRNSSKANKTLQWSGTDSKELYNQHYAKQEYRKHLESYENLSYSYNSYGFRCPEFDCRPSGLAFGCSHTEGVGIFVEDTWPNKLANKLSMHVWNLGVGGASLDTVYRLLNYCVDKTNYSDNFDLDLRFIAINIPPILRFEFVNIENEYQNMSPSLISSLPQYYSKDMFLKEWFLTDLNSQIRQTMVLDAIKFTCAKHKIPLVYTYAELDEHLHSHNERARDLMHYGAAYQQSVADDIYNQISALGPL
jgi:hypothetical protein